jgi:hypothetical protein
MLRLTLTPSRLASDELEEATFTADELRDLVTSHEVGEKDGVAVILGLMKPCPATCWNRGKPDSKDCGGGRTHRHRFNVTHMTAFGADLDDVAEQEAQGHVERFKAMGVAFGVYETFSHDPEAVARGEAKGRYRFLFPFKEPLAIANPQQWTKGAWPLLMKHFGLEDAGDDRSWKDPARVFYLPRKPSPEAEREGAYFPGQSLDVHALISAATAGGDINKLVPPVAVPAPIQVGENEDPTRPVDLEALKRKLVDTHNAQVRVLAERCVRGQLITGLPGEERALTRHEAWWLLTGRLSIVAEDWMATEALLEVLRPSHTKEREKSPDDYTPWDEGRDSVVEMLAMQRATAGTRKAQYKAEREARRQGAHNAINEVLKAKGRPTLEPLPEDGNEEEDEGGAALEQPVIPDLDPGCATLTVEEIKDRLEVKHDSRGEVSYPASIANLALVLTRSAEWAGAFRLNTLTGEPELWPCAAVGNANVERFSPNLITTLRLVLGTSEHYPMRGRREEVEAAAEWAARQNPYDPVLKYLNGLEWDGVKRLDTWLVRYLKAAETAEDGTDLRGYLTAIGKRWLISGVARALKPGCQADSILQLEGEQGVGKSSALRILGGEFYMESTTDFESKDTAVMLSSYWIVELGELTSFTKASESVQKSFLGRCTDVIVRKYERYSSALPRRSIFGGTSNAEEYLTDVTGNRRHWSCRIAGEVDLVALQRDRDQLWAEAKVLFEAGEQWHLTKEEAALAKREAAKRVRTDIIDEMIVQWYRRCRPESRPRKVMAADICRMVLSDDRGITPRAKVTGALKRLGFDSRIVWEDGKPVRRWVAPEDLLKAPHEPTSKEEALERLASSPPTATA